MTLFGRRLPLWLTLLPLVVAAALYWRWWQGESASFRAELVAVLGSGVPIDVGGFPYRLATDLDHLALSSEGSDGSLGFTAERVTIHRQPFVRTLSVIGAAQPRLRARATAFAGANLRIAAPTGRASINRTFGRLNRLSAEFAAADIALGIVSPTLHAQHLEIHLRETPVAPIAFPTGPTLPTQAEIIVRATALRIGRSAPLTLEAAVALTAAAPLRSVRGWAAQSGTLELRRFSLSDTGGSVVQGSMTLAPMANGVLRIVGTASTVCPRTLIAALANGPAPPREYRARQFHTLAFGGTAGAVRPLTDEASLGAFTVRTQEPPCPALR